MSQSTPSDSSSKPATNPSCERCGIRKSQPRRKKKRDRNEILAERSKQYERLLHQKKAPESPTGADVNVTKPAYSPEPRLQKQNQPPSHVIRAAPKTQLVQNQDRTRYLDNGLWTRVVEELVEPVEALEQSSDDNGEEEGLAQDSVDYVLGFPPTPLNVGSIHPSAQQIDQLWQMFTENVDPITKFVHCPSLNPTVQKAMLSPASMSRSLEPLLFAIYTIAILSVDSDECERKFGESREILLSRYSMATKAALQRAKFIDTTNPAVLQAFLIHLLSMRDVYNARTLWTLTGLALRIAEGMGVHQDGSFLDLPPFETEMRRRLWFALKILEARAAELNGSDKARSFDTDPKSPKQPANVNDSDLYPGMSSPPAESAKVTDMIVCVLRFEMRRCWAQNTAKTREQGKDDNLFDSNGSGVSIEEKDKAIDEIETLLEDKIVRYCDPSIPVQLLATIMARGSVNTMRLIAHHQGDGAASNECRNLNVNTFGV